ncbi:MAG: hypothetical protein KF718_23895 [Polyangiaceae bacterium]|nr:hypothetical protein [Polyangiaceae bacterium]
MGARLLCVAVVLAAAGCEQKGDALTERTGARAGSDRSASELAKYAARLAALHAATPADADERVCPDEELAARFDGGVGRLAIAEHAFLARFAGDATDPYAGDGARYKTLTTASLRVIRPPASITSSAQATDALWNAQKLEREYSHIAVLRSRERAGPNMKGDELVSGKLSGVLVVFEIGKSTPLCVARVEAASSDGVAGVEGKAREDAIWNDFVGNVRSSLAAGVKRITKRLDVDI